MRVGIISEGGIDNEIIPPLLQSVLVAVNPRRNVDFETKPFPFPPNGFGQIPKLLKTIMDLFNRPTEWQRLGCDIFVVVHDEKKTQALQREVKAIIRKSPDFPVVYGIAVQETEAWVLGDAESINRHVFRVDPQPRLPSPPERDPAPKRTLERLFLARSRLIEYSAWNIECARLVAPHLRFAQVERHCPRGFARLARELRNIARKHPH